VRYGPFRFEREAIDRNDLYVYPGTTGSTQEAPATVAPLYRPAETPSTIAEAHTEQHSPARPYKRPDGVYIHPADCGCEWCAEDIEPSCASLQGVS
jgi:hypothetical protein